MPESTHVIKPQPPVRAFVPAAVADLAGALLLVAALSQGWHVAFVVVAALLLVAGTALMIGAFVSLNRLAVRFTLTDEGYRLLGPGVDHAGEWADVSKVTQSQEGSHVTIYHGAVRRTHLLFPGGDRAQIDEVLADYVAATLDSLRHVWAGAMTSFPDQIAQMLVFSRQRYDRFNAKGEPIRPWSLISRLRQDQDLLSEAGRAHLARFSNELRGIFSGALARAVKSGEVRGDVDATTTLDPAAVRASLERLIGIAEEWSCLDEYLLNYVVDPSQKATVFASSFAAALELVREGEMEINQKEAFAPIYFRKRQASGAMSAPDLTVE